MATPDIPKVKILFSINVVVRNVQGYIKDMDGIRVK
jgi:hypothetical protein